MNWLLDCNINNGLTELIQAIEASGSAHKTFTMEDEFNGRFGHFPDTEPVVFYGTFQVAELIMARKPSWKPGVIYDPDKMQWNSYAPLLGDRLLNADHRIVPWSSVTDEWESLKETFGEQQLFIRPVSPNKSFSGQVVSDIDRFIRREGVYLADMSPDAEIVVARPRPITEEYRFLAVDGHVVAGSGYREGESVGQAADVPDAAWNYAQEVAEELAGPMLPLRAFIVDVARAGGFSVVEVGPFSCCSLYAMDRQRVVEAINKLEGAN